MQQSSHDELDMSVTVNPAGHDATVATALDRRLSALSAHVADTTAEAPVVAGVPATTGSTSSAPRSKVKIAAVVTEYRRYSHAQHICDRFLIGYGWGNKHHKPLALQVRCIKVGFNKTNAGRRQRLLTNKLANSNYHDNRSWMQKNNDA